MHFSSLGIQIDLTIDRVYVAGWTGRDKKSVNHHIQELSELGISAPSKTPLYYRVAENLLTGTDRIQVLGNKTSGEVEPLLVQHGNTVWLGLGSDHTDRELEAYSVAASKQACAKPVSGELWDFESVENHLDSLMLRCKIKEHDRWITYQEGTLAAIIPLPDLIAESGFGAGAAMFCGTLTAIGGVRPAVEYSMELIDPILNRRITLDYSVVELPVEE
ncbi:MAG: DUF2848 domain-containing protein [Granulosicoccus sp.]